MAWQDRSYYRDPGSSPGSRLLWLLSGSVPLFTLLGIRVRMHASMLIFIAFTLIFAQTSAGLGAKSAATSMAILFISVLLHEFGHCFGARITGGYAEEILMWPLGGLAMTHPPHRPGASFVTTILGPGVNFGICVFTGLALYLLDRGPTSIPWLPFAYGLKHYVPSDNLTFYIWWVFMVNYGLLMFNLCMVFFPFDGGRIVQEILWVFIGYHRSMQIATVVGMIGAVGVAAFGLMEHSSMLVLIAIFGFIQCYRQRMILREVGPEELGDGTDYSAAYEPQTPRRRRSKISQRALRKARKQAMEARLEQERIDQILAKVSAHGMASLTWGERRALRKATEHIRKRDLELTK